MTNHRLCTLFTLLITVCLTYAQIVVVDDVDRQPLPGASLFRADNSIVALSDSTGCLRNVSEDAYPLTLRYLGFKDAVLHQPVDTVVMEQSSLPLSEVVVTDKADGVHMVCYMRELSTCYTSDKSETLYTESMVDYVVPLYEKVKGFKTLSKPRTLATRNKLRRTQTGKPDSAAVNVKDKQMLSSYFAEYRGTEETEPESLCGQTHGFAVDNKDSRVTYLKSPKGVVVTGDFLSNKDGHHWSPGFLKVLGLTTDFDELFFQKVYTPSDNGRHPVYDLKSRRVVLSATASGKLFKAAFKTKEPIKIYSVMEIVPVSYELITAQESKQIAGNKDVAPIEIAAPAWLTPWN